MSDGSAELLQLEVAMIGVRQFLHKNKYFGYAGIGVLFLTAGVLGYWLNSDGMPSSLKQAYYTDDDGKTWFVDDIKRIPPFDHNGKQAYMAMVFRVGSNPPFVAFMQGYKPDVQKKLEILTAQAQATVNPDIQNLRDSGLLVKAPVEAQWHPAQSKQGTDIATVRAPSGEMGDLQAIYP